MRWHSTPIARPGRRKKGSGVFGWPAFGKRGRTQKPHRVKQEIEIYFNLFYDTRIITTVRERLAQTGLTGPAINLIREVAREMYDKEDEQTRAAVAAEMAIQRQGNDVDSEDDSEDLEEARTPTPEQYQE